MKKLQLVFLILVFSLALKAQYFQTGQDPAKLKWRQINTENFQLIYPDYYEDQAQQLAQKLEMVYNYASYSLDHQPKKISVILHTQTVNSNGLVAYAPKRSEFYTTPNQSIYPLDWLEQLAVHEFRHVVQTDKINSELPGIIKVLLGEQGTALVFGAYLPWWFIEGDAVSTETALTDYGRGRLPSFLMEHRAQVVEKGKYSYDKAYLGSFKDYVPNHYQLGYYLVGNTRARYGTDIWENVITRVGEKPLSVTPFNTALKKETGMKKVALYNSVFDSLNHVWQKEVDNFDSESIAPVLEKTPKVYTNYNYNHWLNNGEIVSYKTSLNRIPAFVKIEKNGNEKVLHQPGKIFDESVSYQGEWIVWSEQIPDLRWSHSGRSEIQLLNISTGKRFSFQPEFKAFAPVVSPDLNTVALVEADFSNNYFLSVYNLTTKELVKRIQTPDNNYILSPEWLNANEIVAVILTRNGKRIAKFHPDTGKYELLFDRELVDIKQLRIHNNELYFISSYSGRDALYEFNLETKELKQVYEPIFGVAYPAISANGQIVVSDYTSDGYRLVHLKMRSEKNIDEISPGQYLLAETIASQELGKPVFSTTDTTQYPSKVYSKTKHLFNFHSWAPVFVDPYAYEFAPGVSVVSQNLLGTAETVLGYKWDASEETGQLYARYIYKGWYPVFDFKLSGGKHASNYYLITEHMRNGEVVSRDTSLERYTWNETALTAALKLPLNLSRGKYFRTLQPEINYEYTRNKNDDSTPEGFPEGNFQSLSYRLYYHQILRSSHQDILPDFGVILDGSFHHSPFGDKNLGTLVGAQGIFYLPGFLTNHGTKLYGGTQNRIDGDHYSFSDIVRFPRGWGKVSSKKLSVAGIDYKLPILNPDLSLGGLSYIRRISATLFYDYATLSRYQYRDGSLIGTFNQSISSFGVELIGDVNFLRFYAPVKIGFRTSYLPEIDDTSFEFLLSVDFNSL